MPAPSLPEMDEHVELQLLLGRGGMGHVYEGVQRHLGRQVAVKVLAPTPDPRAADALLREARVLGALEHPGIVPAHLLLKDARGEPALVMKRVEGRLWVGALRDPERRRRELSQNLRVLIQLCQAVQYAHEQGVVHRDLKPENVMLGRFGEVYLMDWGAARSLTGDKAPPVSELEGPVGTPIYMAPEQARSEREAIGVATDVYLLGGCLTALLAGRGPRLGPSVQSAMAAAATGELLPWPKGVPAGLARIAEHALAPDPSDRYRSAAALREDVEAWLGRLAAIELAEQAQSHVSSIRAAIDAGEVGLADRLFTEARFVLRLARQRWPESPEAIDTLQTLLCGQIEWALDQGDARTAERLMGELPRAAPALAGRLEEALAIAKREEDEVAALRELAGHVDVGRGHQQRRRLLMVLSTFGGVYIALGWLGRLGAIVLGYRLLAGLFLFAAAAFVGVERYARRRLPDTRANRGLRAALWLSLLAPLCALPVCWQAGAPPAVVVALTVLGFALVSAFLASHLSVPLWQPLAVWLPAALVAGFFPEWAFDMLGLGLLGSSPLAIRAGVAAREAATA